jgi:hypothetical protein
MACSLNCLLAFPTFMMMTLHSPAVDHLANVTQTPTLSTPRQDSCRLKRILPWPGPAQVSSPRLEATARVRSQLCSTGRDRPRPCENPNCDAILEVFDHHPDQKNRIQSDLSGRGLRVRQDIRVFTQARPIPDASARPPRGPIASRRVGGSAPIVRDQKKVHCRRHNPHC